MLTEVLAGAWERLEQGRGYRCCAGYAFSFLIGD
jgi:hypothetical protein